MTKLWGIGFLLLGVLAIVCWVTGLPVWGGLLVMVIAAAIWAEPKARETVIRWFNWLDAKTDPAFRVFLLAGAVALLLWWDGAPWWLPLGVVILLASMFVGGIVIHFRPIRLLSYRPSVLIDPVVYYVTSIFCLAFVAAKLIAGVSAWYWFPVHFLVGLIGGFLLSLLALFAVQFGYNSMQPVIIEEPQKPADAKIADPDELKRKGLAHEE